MGYIFVAMSCQMTKVKNQIFQAKKGRKMYNVPQKKPKNMYNKDSARKSKISHKKIDFFVIFWYFT